MGSKFTVGGDAGAGSEDDDYDHSSLVDAAEAGGVVSDEFEHISNVSTNGTNNGGDDSVYFDSQSSPAKPATAARPTRSGTVTSATASAGARTPSVSDAGYDGESETNTTTRPAFGERNRNPSMSSHMHPGKLPFHSRAASMSSNDSRSRLRAGAPERLPSFKRASSASSVRSSEAAMHPFPTPSANGMPTRDPSQSAYKSQEEYRLDEDERKEKHWKRWGPYLSERQWVRSQPTPIRKG